MGVGASINNALLLAKGFEVFFVIGTILFARGLHVVLVLEAGKMRCVNRAMPPRLAIRASRHMFRPSRFACALRYAIGVLNASRLMLNAPSFKACVSRSMLNAHAFAPPASHAARSLLCTVPVIIHLE